MRAPAPIRHMGPRDALMVVVAAAGFGSSFLFIGIVVTEVPPVTLACARSLVTLATLLALSGYRLPRPGRIWWQLGALGAATQVVPMILLSWGQKSIPSGLAGIILGSVPVVTLVLAHIFMHDERMSARSLLGALVGFTGVIVVIGRGLLAGADAHLVAELAVFGAAVSIAAANIIGRRAAHLPPLVLATSSQFAAVVLLLPLSAAVDRPWSLEPSWSAVGALLVLGTLGSALPGYVFYRLLVRVGATRASLVAYLAPVVAVALGAAVLDERLGWSALAGLALILVGAMLVNQRIARPSSGG